MQLFQLAEHVLHRALDGVSLRQRVTAENIANVNTPGYKRGVVGFERELQQALGRGARLRGWRTHDRHLPIGRVGSLDTPFAVGIDRSTTMRNDGNNVDIDRATTQLGKDTVQYNALSQQVALRYAALRTAISEGRR